MKERKVNYLSDILPGERAVIGHLETKGDMRRRLLDIGLTENTVVECVGKSPPVSYTHLFGVVSLILLLTGVVGSVIPSVICIALSAVFLSALLIFHGNSLMSEISRRMHM